MTFAGLVAMFTALITGPFQAYAADTNAAAHYPVIAENGNIIGTVHISRSGNELRMDYDFGEPASYKLESITTQFGSSGTIKVYTVTSPDGTTLKDFENTYIAPRDAVLAFDATHMNQNPLWISSTLRFNNNGTPTNAWVGTNKPSSEGGYFYFPHYSTHQSQTYTSSSSKSVVRSYSSVSTGKQYSAIRVSGSSTPYYPQKGGTTPAYPPQTGSAPTPTSASGEWYEGMTSGDGYVLQYNEETNTWYYAACTTQCQAQEEEAAGWYEGMTSGDGYVLRYNEAENVWFYEYVGP